MTWMPPHDMDHECVALCRALNAYPGISTTCSCCGHGKREYHIWFNATNLEALPDVLYWFDGCHSGYYGWRVVAQTDCGKSPTSFMIEGPMGAFDQANDIADYLESDRAAASRLEPSI